LVSPSLASSIKRVNLLLQEDGIKAACRLESFSSHLTLAHGGTVMELVKKLTSSQKMADTQLLQQEQELGGHCELARSSAQLRAEPASSPPAQSVKPTRCGRST
ncbi:hypothetical protein RRG08_058601, partial [Elysia crispata]